MRDAADIPRTCRPSRAPGKLWDVERLSGPRSSASSGAGTPAVVGPLFTCWEKHGVARRSRGQFEGATGKGVFVGGPKCRELMFVNQEIPRSAGTRARSGLPVETLIIGGRGAADFSGPVELPRPGCAADGGPPSLRILPRSPKIGNANCSLLVLGRWSWAAGTTSTRCLCPRGIPDPLDGLPRTSGLVRIARMISPRRPATTGVTLDRAALGVDGRLCIVAISLARSSWTLSASVLVCFMVEDAVARQAEARPVGGHAGWKQPNNQRSTELQAALACVIVATGRYASARMKQGFEHGSPGTK